MSLKTPQIFEQMVLNAIDFLEQASSEAETRPKYATLHLATAIEILLKARIVAEHWSIIVKREANQRKFSEGDFVSLSLRESIAVLRDVVGTPLKPNCEIAFISLSNHRNRIVHFFSLVVSEGLSSDREKAIQEILVSIYYLSDFLRDHQSVFEQNYSGLLAAISKVKNNRQFLEAKFEDKKSKIDEARDAGSVVLPCRVCSFESAISEPPNGITSPIECMVCEESDTLITIGCPEECGLPIRYFTSDGFQLRDCECGAQIDQSDLFNAVDISNPFDPDHSTIHCNFCGTMDLVAEYAHGYICCECLTIQEYYSVCGWCSQAQLTDADLEYSTWNGCEYCDGRKGWDRD